MGCNKIAPDREQTIHPVHHAADPLNTKKYNLSPCIIKSGQCYNRSSPEWSCNAPLIHSKKMNGTEETEVILINEELNL